MNLKNIALSLLDVFRLSKGRKIADEPAVPLAPLIQRLSLPPVPDWMCFDKARFVVEVIQEKFPGGKISRRVLGKICRYYGVNLRGCGLFRAVPENSTMLALKSAGA